MYKDSEIQITTAEDGASVAVLDVDSNTLPGVQVDTYHMLNGDSWMENLLDYFGSGESEAPYDSDKYDDYDWDYDHAGIIASLAESSIAGIMDQLGSDGIIRSIEFISTYSPREYNFTSDSYKATYTLDLAKLANWCTENNFDADAYAAEHHCSYDGFMSFVSGWLEDPARREGTVLWLQLDAYMRSELDTDELNQLLWEAEDEVYDANVTITRCEA